ncbi:serine acetyltransferase [Rhizobium sp. C4]|nr:serine acetyltransferase [Rhizobium sp. C4]
MISTMPHHPMRELLRSDYDHFLRLSLAPEGMALWRMLLHPRTLPVAMIRLAAAAETNRLSPIGAVIRFLILFGFRVEVPKGCIIGPGFVLPHPGGIVLGSSKIGENVIVFQNVTLGARAFDGAFDRATRPIIGNGVVIGAGAVVLGPVTVGDGATVAANSLVTRDVPAGATAIGVPAEVKQT